MGLEGEEIEFIRRAGTWLGTKSQRLGTISRRVIIGLEVPPEHQGDQAPPNSDIHGHKGQHGEDGHTYAWLWKWGLNSGRAGRLYEIETPLLKGSRLYFSVQNPAQWQQFEKHLGMGLKLSDHQLNTHCYIHRILYMKLYNRYTNTKEKGIQA